MYPESGLMFFPYLNGVLPDLCNNQQFELLQSIREDDLSNVVQSRMVTEYDLGGDGDLFKAPEPIVEAPAEYDIVTAAISSMISPEEAAEGDLAAAIEVSISDSKRNHLHEKSESPAAIGDCQMQRSESSGSLRRTRPNFLDFQGINMESVFGMRKAFSEGDIQNLGQAQTTLPPRGPPPLPPITDRIEDRSQKLSRYRRKKTKRNFGRKIEYACRKALADSQPRVRGRFARTEESEPTARTSK